MKTIYFVLPTYEAKWKVSLSGVTPPTGPTYLYSFARSINFGKYENGRCIDLSIHDENTILSMIDETDLVCITTTVSNYPQALNFGRKAKEKGAKVAIGGPWASVKAVQIAKKQPWIDHIVIGEGESALEKIIKGEADKKILKIKNKPIFLLPQITFSGWTMQDLRKYQEEYSKMLKTGRYGKIPEVIPFFVLYQSSRGCIQKPRCGFCGSRLGEVYMARTGEQFYKDIEKIIEEISPINERIHIFDCSDSFTTGIQRFKEYHSYPNVTLTVYARADEITIETARKLRELGVTKVSIGIETGSKEMMEQIGKNVDVNIHKRVLEILKDNGIQVYVNLMYGIPNEKKEDIERTVDHFYELAKVGNIYRVAGRITTPLPHARWYYQLLNKLKTKDPKRSERIHSDDWIDVEEVQKLWLKEMTFLSMDDIVKAHEKLVKIAKEENISISSETPRGIV